MNAMKSVLLLGTMTGLLMAAGAAAGGRQGMLLMLGVSTIMNFAGWFFSDSMVLKSTGAEPLLESEAPWLHHDLDVLSERAGIPKPGLYILRNQGSPNAFATGRSPERGVVAVTEGLLHTLDRREVRGVIAHELGHIKHRDTLVSSIAATLAGALTYLAYSARYTRSRRASPLLPLVALAAPLLAGLIRMAISRTREYMADERAARLTGDPEGLASALEGLSRGVSARPMPPGRASAVHFIVNGFTGGMARMFSTHPPIPERAKRLRAMTVDTLPFE